MVDISRQNSEWWESQISINKDHYTLTFRSDDSEKALRQSLEDAIRRLMSEVVSRR